MTIDDTVARVRDRMTHVPGLAALILIGSTARGDRQKNSDIDIVALIYDDAPWPVRFRDGAARLSSTPTESRSNWRSPRSDGSVGA